MLKNRKVIAEICLLERAGLPRSSEPVRCGFCAESEREELEPKGLELRSDKDEVIPAKFRRLVFHHRNHHLQWWLLEFLSSVPANSDTVYYICLADAIQTEDASLHRSEFHLRSKQGVVRYQDNSGTNGFEISMFLQLASGGVKKIPLGSVHSNPDHEITARYESSAFGCRFRIDLTTFDSGRLVKLDVSMLNPDRAEHRGGFWDLGDPQSMLIEQWFVEVDRFGSETDSTSSGPESIELRWTNGEHQEMRCSSEPYLHIHQFSSGGDNWNSRNHILFNKEISLERKGFSEKNSFGVNHGDRSQPRIEIRTNGTIYAFCFPRFWESFPNSLEVLGAKVRWSLLPKSAYVHELQGGEGVSKTVWFENRMESDQATRLPGLLNPLIAMQKHAPEDSFTPAIPSSEKYHAEHQTFLARMWGGETSFFVKRESIDEYGWRNFGDFWADHEQVYSECEGRIISHYNNQYDLLFGLLVEFERTGDHKCFTLSRDLADHILNTDIYKTEKDRAVYNNGLFWHTSHYRDAGTCSHRCYSQSMRTGRHSMQGGGLSNEHTYSQGLMHFYLKTGETAFRDAVVKMGKRVIAMDDGNLHWLAPFSGLPTGAASATSNDEFHGLGRGVGNSINTLIDSWTVTGDDVYLKKAKELIYRTIHPKDNFDQLGYGDIELRWSYPVAIQSLLRYLVVIPDRDGIHEYIVQCLASIGNWMFEHCQPTLDTPEKLEFPTETWAAQDLRKANCLLSISRIPGIEQGQRFEQKGLEFFDVVWNQLMRYESADFTRPRALVLQQLPWRYGDIGFGHLNALQTSDINPPERVCFVSQSNDFRNKLRSLKGLVSIAVRAFSNPLRFRILLQESIIGRISRICRRRYIRVIDK